MYRPYGKRTGLYSGPGRSLRRTSYGRSASAGLSARGMNNFTGARGGELKFNDVSFGYAEGGALDVPKAVPVDGLVVMGTPNAANPYNQAILGIAQGTSPTTRIGRSIKVKSLELRGLLSSEGGNLANAGCVVRVIVGVARQKNSTNTQVLPSDILQPVNNVVTYTSSYNLANEQAFRILADTTHELQTFSTIGAVQSSRLIHYHKSFALSMVTDYKNGNTDGSEIVSNDLFVLFISSNNGNQVGSDPPLPIIRCAMKARVRFQDDV